MASFGVSYAFEVELLAVMQTVDFISSTLGTLFGLNVIPCMWCLY